MQYKFHDNGWTVFLYDVNLKNITQQEVNTMAKLIAKYTLVVIREQNLSIEDELRVVNMFKEPLPMIRDPNDPNFASHAADLKKDPAGIIQRVTGEKNETGEGGLGAWKEAMDWHSNDPASPDRRPIIWLYSVYGSEGSVTSYNNSVLAYNDLPKEDKERLKNLKLVLKTGVSTRETDIDTPEDLARQQISNRYKPNLVMTNNAGQTGLFYPFNQTSHLEPCTEQENTEIKKWLSSYITQDKYVYHHHWKDGDVLIGEQWLGIHKRHYFENIESRLLHRSAFDFPDQDYTNIEL